MTYTFKLSRRLAVSHYGLFALLAVVTGCAAGDSLAPEVPATTTDAGAGTPDATIDVTPDTLTLEVGQAVRFTGRVRSSSTDTASTSVEWSATGGTIASDGTFSSSTVGSFQIVGRRSRKQADTSVVVVVAPQPTLASITLTPATVSVVAGATQQFAAAAKLSDGSATTVGLVWTATGGSIDAAGKYTAGSTAGQYRVIVANTTGTIADTAAVTVTVPAPTLASVTLTPASASLTTGTTKQFAAYGRMSNGDSVAVAVTFSATGGTISGTGLYTAGSTAGTFRVIAAAASGQADTAVVTLAAPLAPAPAPAPTPSTGTVGVPYGAYTLLSSTSSVGTLNLSFDSYSASDIVTRINAARTKHMRLLLALTGGAHSNYMTNGVFDRAKWNAKMDTYNTSTIKSAIAAGVSDGTIIGASVMDEPNVSGTSGGNTWGPVGTMTKARVDSMCGYVKAMFPTLPAGVVQRHDAFEPTKSYYVCDFIVDQYVVRAGSVTTFRDAGLAMAKRDGIGILFSLNVLDGGTPDTDGTYDCAGTGGLGTYGTNCRMTAQQVRDFGTTLGPAGCALLMWKYDATFMTNANNLLAFGDVGATLATASAKSCRRS